MSDVSDTESSIWILSLAYLKANGSKYHSESVDLFIIKRKLYLKIEFDFINLICN